MVLVRCAGILAGKEGAKSASGRLCSQADVAVEGHASFYIPPWLVQETARLIIFRCYNSFLVKGGRDGRQPGERAEQAKLSRRHRVGAVQLLGLQNDYFS